MSNNKLKTENYQGLGGINVKFSPYITGANEHLDLQNFDFQMPGALTQTWGSTMYVGQTLPGRISSLFEFARLSGASYILFGCTGAMYYGATTGLSQGMSFLSQSLYAVNGALGVRMDNVAWSGASGVYVATVNAKYYGQGNVQLGNGTSVTFSGQTLANNFTSFAVLNNYLFAANGSQFYKFDGATTSFVGSPVMLPAGIVAGLPAVKNNASSTDMGVGATGSYLFYASYVNSRGFEGQIWPMSSVNASTADSASLGGTFISGLQQLVLMPTQYDVASVNVYSYWAATLLTVSDPETWLSRPYVFQRNISASSGLTTSSGYTVLPINLGTTLGGISYLIGNVGALPDPITNQYAPLGFTLPINAFNIVGNIQMSPMVPQYISAYQNRLFLSGFSGLPSTVVFSDVGEPEGYLYDNNFEVRTNDSDVLVGQIPYATRMYFFKRKSFHVLSGDSPSNYQLQAVSVQYGAVNNRCIITFGEDEILAFLDRKGIMFFNGAKPQHASIKMQPYFDRMNYTAAITEACMAHDKLRNQILCAIPIDDSSINNITIVYDYAANAWTTRKGVAPAIYARMTGRNQTENAFYGSYSGIIAWYGASFTTDSGVGFTCVLKSRFNHEMGDSVQKQFRRFYMNMDPPSATLSIPIHFYQDYGTSRVLSTTFVIGQFQNRLEYGISAKALAFEIYYMATTSPLRIYGYTIEERMQRKV